MKVHTNKNIRAALIELDGYKKKSKQQWPEKKKGQQSCVALEDGQSQRSWRKGKYDRNILNEFLKELIKNK